ncbi:MAG: LOG family protein [Candidatus Binataceae bacterium]
MDEDPARKGTSDTVVLSDEKHVVEMLHQSIMGLWEVVNNLTRLRPTQRSEFRVTIFGSARIPHDHWVYGAVRDLAKELALMGCAIVTGGGPGLMEAANEGAAQAGSALRGSSVGIRVHLPFEQEVNPFVDQAFAHRTFFSRLHHFVLVSDAFVVVPGGIGTVLELSMIWQLLQVRNLQNTPLILVGRMWADFVAWARQHLLRPELDLAAPEDLEIPRCVDTAEQAMAIIHGCYHEWQARSGNISER